jgi:hypothetical protein
MRIKLRFWQLFEKFSLVYTLSEDGVGCSIYACRCEKSVDFVTVKEKEPQNSIFIYYAL